MLIIRKFGSTMQIGSEVYYQEEVVWEQLADEMWERSNDLIERQHGTANWEPEFEKAMSQLDDIVSAKIEKLKKKHNLKFRRPRRWQSD